MTSILENIGILSTCRAFLVGYGCCSLGYPFSWTLTHLHVACPKTTVRHKQHRNEQHRNRDDERWWIHLDSNRVLMVNHGQPLKIDCGFAVAGRAPFRPSNAICFLFAGPKKCGALGKMLTVSGCMCHFCLEITVQQVAK